MNLVVIGYIVRLHQTNSHIWLIEFKIKLKIEYDETIPWIIMIIYKQETKIEETR